jgi:hypothetical protein
MSHEPPDPFLDDLRDQLRQAHNDNAKLRKMLMLCLSTFEHLSHVNTGDIKERIKTILWETE